jgi:hypothetical protein
MRQQAIDLVVDAWWSSFYGIGRHVPVVLTTRKRLAAAERNAFDLGRDAEHYYPGEARTAECQPHWDATRQRDLTARF